MNAAILIVITMACFALGYRFYSQFLASKIFGLDDTQKTPAVALTDGTDFVPTPKGILWGHHFSSIAGAAPIVGPAVAVIWGWLPALIWVVVGTVFMGAAHDFGALVLSMRHEGRSMAGVTAHVLSPRARNLFMVVVLFLVWMVIAVFALVIASLFVSFPTSVIPVNFQIIVALLIGYFINRKGKNITLAAILAQVCLFAMIYVGSLYPISLPETFFSPTMSWVIFLLIYSFVASILPVWALLQPRDYINSHQLLIGLGAILLGVLILQPQVVAPVFQAQPTGAPPWFPFLFITIACGAISGFHGLVSAGTTSKQVARWTDARSIGYGGMIGEGTLAMLATLAVSAGFASTEEWHHHYASWGEAQGLSSAIEAFVIGASRFLSALGIPPVFGETMMSVLIISFAATSLDTAARIQRYILAETGEAFGVKKLQNPVIGSAIAVGSAFLLMVLQEGGKGGLLIWPLFGACNQMLAALTLIVISAYLIRTKRSPWPFLIPMVLVLLVTTLGLVLNALDFLKGDQPFLALLAIFLLAIEVWLTMEAWALFKAPQDPAQAHQ